MACGSSTLFRGGGDAATSVLADGGDAAEPMLAAGGDAAGSMLADEGSDDARSTEDASDADGGLNPNLFITGVVSVNYGPCAGFGQSAMPGVVEGPPIGGGSDRGSTSVVSLGNGGEIVVSFAPNAIVDGPGVDFIVFENPFWVGGNSNDIYAEPGEVSVSDDGVTWYVFPCNPTQDPLSPYGTGVAPPYGDCAGWRVVLSSPSNGISPFDPSVSGGDPFDLADIGVTRAHYVRIVDKTSEDCPDTGSEVDTNGFDLDAISIVNAENP
jgi:hypothetical protein